MVTGGDMVTDHAVSTGSARGSHAGNGWRRRPLVLTASLAAVVGFIGWIAVLALTLPTRYLAATGTWPGPGLT